VTKNRQINWSLFGSLFDWKSIENRSKIIKKHDFYHFLEQKSGPKVHQISIQSPPANRCGGNPGMCHKSGPESGCFCQFPRPQGRDWGTPRSTLVFSPGRVFVFSIQSTFCPEKRYFSQGVKNRDLSRSKSIHSGDEIYK
jgi:hypothetical protein